ncbi:MAG: PIG-L deacetylase family protein [Bacteroidota bacterium]|jgi:LmbE family N-acetylglucosaminyl deacetylase
MKKILFILSLLFIGHFVTAQEKSRIIVIGAHPDDCDSDAGGLAALLAEMGHAVKFVAVTNGDAGHHKIQGKALAERRYAETQEVAKRLGVTYDVLDNHDGMLLPNLEVRLQIIRKIREWNADVVIAPRPNDYHPDHRYTGVLVQDAAYMVAVPNIAYDVPALRKNPVFLYTRDNFQRPNPFRPDIAVDITSVYKKKISGLDAHVSQFYEWMPWIGHYEKDVPAGKEERFQWLMKRYEETIKPEFRASLIKWYGEEKAKQVKYVEAFEICEYGAQPSEEEIRRLFPMLRK